MGLWSVLLFGELDELKVKELQVLFDIKDYDKAKELYCKIRTDLEAK